MAVWFNIAQHVNLTGALVMLFCVCAYLWTVFLNLPVMYCTLWRNALVNIEKVIRLARFLKFLVSANEWSVAMSSVCLLSDIHDGHSVVFVNTDRSWERGRERDGESFNVLEKGAGIELVYGWSASLLLFTHIHKSHTHMIYIYSVCVCVWMCSFVYECKQ